MKLAIEFANGEERELVVDSQDFSVASGKIFNQKAVKIDNTYFSTAMIIKIEEVKDEN